MEKTDWEKIEHFTPGEWGKDPARAAFPLVSAVDRLRDEAGVPVIIHVCWDDSGHAAKSFHYKGEAADLHFGRGKNGPLSVMEQFALICALPFGGIGFYPEWAPCPGWHVDIRPGNRVMWVRKENRYEYGPKVLARAIEEALHG
ncbi:MAG: hypothetical protein AB1921_16465 [Thermodesulfobacteriota bacterium]